jgi:hypothetical protein
VQAAAIHMGNTITFVAACRCMRALFSKRVCGLAVGRKTRLICNVSRVDRVDVEVAAFL